MIKDYQPAGILMRIRAKALRLEIKVDPAAGWQKLPGRIESVRGPEVPFGGLWSRASFCAR